MATFPPDNHIFDFENLFVFEMANNHQGSVEHGKLIIREMAALAREKGIRAAVKLQFRDLDTFIHPDFKGSTENKHIPRFLSTRLSADQFKELLDETRAQGLLTMVTPFDEPSVDLIEKLDVDIVKIGSCSAHDWPLIARAAEAGKPMIVSTGGLRMVEIDRIVSFLEHRAVQFALMHCVAIYPTPEEKFHLNQIEVMKKRYPGVTIGFSTHEDPSDTTIVGLAYAKGARIFEKHVGVATDTIKLNAYSATPAQVRAWVDAQKHAVALCGHEGEREISDKEKEDLRSLMRGVWAKREIRAGEVIKREDIYFAFPLQQDQMRSGRFQEGYIAAQDYGVNEALPAKVEPPRPTKKDIVYGSIRTAKGMLNNAQIHIGHEFAVELSHHYGLSQFEQYGCTIIECFNREYAKKLIIQTPGQWNPTHYHKQKDETFYVLSGILLAEIEGRKKILYPGDTLWVPRGTWHAFGTETGAVLEEISTTAVGSDSFYIDRAVSKIPRDERKTRLVNWGRHQFDHLGENLD
ncbi:MAG: N-acetylneuraminate synthase family protein [Patescibacteria group bacterium]